MVIGTGCSTNSCSSRVLKPHNDGGNPYGDLFPDFLFMVCERTADEGGESYMVDGHSILRSLPEEQREAYFGTPVEARNFDKMRGKQAVWRSPMVQRVAGSGRWCLRAEGGGGFNRDQPCEAHLEKGAELMTAWDTARDVAGAAAPRFRVLPGQAMVVDNYRWLHAREPSQDSEDSGGRLLWRVWVWTQHRMQHALPSNCLCMCHPLGRSAGARLTNARDDAGCPHCTFGSQPDTYDKLAEGPNTDEFGEWPGLA